MAQSDTKTPQEIGGYFSLDLHVYPLRHPDGVYLNSGRNALRYCIRACALQAVQVPFYTCPDVWRALSAEGCKCIPYEIDDAMMPMGVTTSLPILYTNYFGVCTENIHRLLNNFPLVIVDNAQAFFCDPAGSASFYSPRKFFGLPDGGIAVTGPRLSENFSIALSWEHCSHLLRRIDSGASAAYADFRKNEERISRQPIQYMSQCSYALLQNIDADAVIKRRNQNFSFLHKCLCATNAFAMQISETDVPMVYPYRTSHKKLRKKMLNNSIFVARYWPAANDSYCMTSRRAQTFADEILPLPIDQRYDERDMQRILEVIFG